MGNKKKGTRISVSEDDKTATKKYKKNKSLEKDVSEPSKVAKSEIVEERNKIRERKNKKLNLSNDKEFNNLCDGELEDACMNNPSAYVHQKTDKKIKNEKRKLEKDIEVLDIDPPNLKKVKTKRNKDQESKIEIKSKNYLNVLEDERAAREKTVNKKNRKFLNADEAEVNDEDIDKFCDELTEEDNKTYENWVKLFEVNFNKNKKLA